MTEVAKSTLFFESRLTEELEGAPPIGILSAANPDEVEREPSRDIVPRQLGCPKYAPGLILSVNYLSLGLLLQSRRKLRLRTDARSIDALVDRKSLAI